jgi:prolyl oligopeptidase
VDVNNPSASNWLDFIPETENVLSPSTGGGFIFQLYEDAVSVVKQYDYSGKMLRLNCGLGSAGGFSGKKKRNIVLFFY